MRQLLSSAALMAVAFCPLLQPRAAQAAPATEQEIRIYASVAAAAACNAAGLGLEFPKAVRVGGDALAGAIQAFNDSAISGVSDEPLSDENLLRGSTDKIVIGMAMSCPSLMPAELLSEVKQKLGSVGVDIDAVPGQVSE